MPRGGYRPGAGRPRKGEPPKQKLSKEALQVVARKGSRDKKSLPSQLTDREAELAVAGIQPLEYFLHTLRDPTLDRAERMEAARNAAPYIHPRLVSTENKNLNKSLVVVRIEGDDAGLL